MPRQAERRMRPRARVAGRFPSGCSLNQSSQVKAATILERSHQGLMPPGGSGRVDFERRLRLGESLDWGENQPPELPLVRRAPRLPTSDEFSLMSAVDVVLVMSRSRATA